MSQRGFLTRWLGVVSRYNCVISTHTERISESFGPFKSWVILSDTILLSRNASALAIALSLAVAFVPFLASLLAYALFFGIKQFLCHSNLYTGVIYKILQKIKVFLYLYLEILEVFHQTLLLNSLINT